MTARRPPVERPLAAAVAALAILVAGALGLACATNPATGKRQLALISEQQEIELGRENHPQVLAAFGDYDDDDLEAYVRRIGESLAAESERPGLPWTFEVLDDASVNAMALPGGFIYVTRGILAHMSSEAELAAVLGHEIGHVTARHSVNQLSKQQLYGGLLAVGMIASPELRAFGDVAGTGLGLLFLKFGRDAERQADDLGLRYMTRGGYDAREMPGMFQMLEAVSGLAEGGRAPTWLSTHPNPDARGRRATSAVRGLDPSQLGGRVAEQEHLARVDGVVFGADPRQGYFLEETFLHPQLAFAMEFPRGWKRANGRSQVVGVSAEQDMVVELSLVEAESAGEAAREFMSQEGVERVRSGPERVNGLSAAGGRFEVESETRPLRGSVVFVEHGGSVFRLLGYGLAEPVAERFGVIESSLESFRPISDPEVLGVGPDRLELVELAAPMTLEAFASRYPSVIDVDRLAALNRVEKGETLPAGRTVKRVVGRRPLPALD